MRRLIILAICMLAATISTKAQDIVISSRTSDSHTPDIVISSQSPGTQANDIITKKDSTQISAKILNISDTDIHYKLSDYLDGPDFSLKIREVASIAFANGMIQEFVNEEAQRIAEKGISLRMAYCDYKHIYDPKQYIGAPMEPYSPVLSGVASFLIPGMGQMFNGQVGKGIGIMCGEAGLIFGGAFIAGLSSTPNQYNEMVASPGGTATFLMCLAGALAIDIWSIFDAVKVAKIKDLYYRDCQKLMSNSYTIKILPKVEISQTNEGLQPVAGMSLAVNF